MNSARILGQTCHLQVLIFRKVRKPTLKLRKTLNRKQRKDQSTKKTLLRHQTYMHTSPAPPNGNTISIHSPSAEPDSDLESEAGSDSWEDSSDNQETCFTLRDLQSEQTNSNVSEVIQAGNSGRPLSRMKERSGRPQRSRVFRTIERGNDRFGHPHRSATVKTGGIIADFGWHRLDAFGH